MTLFQKYFITSNFLKDTNTIQHNTNTSTVLFYPSPVIFSNLK